MMAHIENIATCHPTVTERADSYYLSRIWDAMDETGCYDSAVINLSFENLKGVWDQINNNWKWAHIIQDRQKIMF